MWFASLVTKAGGKIENAIRLSQLDLIDEARQKHDSWNTEFFVWFDKHGADTIGGALAYNNG